MIDKYSIVPILACLFATILGPLILAACSPDDYACLYAPRPEFRIFWPILAAISVVMAAQNYSRISFPPHVVCLLAYLGFAGASALWAFSPEQSFVRFAQQAMIVASIVLPATLAGRNADILRGLFLCFALASLLNFIFVFERPPIEGKFVTNGYPGYFSGKNYLGECAAAALLPSLHEALHPGMRRAVGIVVAIVAVTLIFLSNIQDRPGSGDPGSAAGLVGIEGPKEDACLAGDHFPISAA